MIQNNTYQYLKYLKSFFFSRY